MKIIDKTPLLDEKGELGILQRFQGMMQFGSKWPVELQAQKAIITFFDRQLEKGYTLIRNYTLGQSGIMVPLILLGPSGIYVIHISYLRGQYEVRGDTWNVAAGDGYQPAPVNVVQRTIRMANAVKAFIERQGVTVPVNIEPVLIAGDPGLHIDSVRPAIRVMMIDGIKSFVTGLATARPILSTETVFELTERIINPHPPKKKGGLAVGLELDVPGEEDTPQRDVSRARTIFDASEEARPFNPGDFDFSMLDEEPESVIAPPDSSVHETDLAEPLPRPKQRTNRILGMTPGQLAVIAALGLALMCIAAAFVYLLLS